jgi:hypothetical protein
VTHQARAFCKVKNTYNLQILKLSLEPFKNLNDRLTYNIFGSGGQCGFDAGIKIKGRKRHIAVDTMGNLLAVCVHSGGHKIGAALGC